MPLNLRNALAQRVTVIIGMQSVTIMRIFRLLVSSESSAVW